MNCVAESNDQSLQWIYLNMINRICENNIILVSIHDIFPNYLYDAYTISKSRSKTDNEFQAIDFCGAGIIWLPFKS